MIEVAADGLPGGLVKFGDARPACAGRRAHQHALLGGKPLQQRVFLHPVGWEGKLVEVHLREFVAAFDFGHAVPVA